MFKMTQHKQERPARYVIYYRSGGTLNFKWQRILNRFVEGDTLTKKVEEILKQGYPVCVRLEELDPPITYLPDDATDPFATRK